METVAFTFRDDDGTTVGKIPVHTGNDAIEMQWRSIDKQLNLYVSHVGFIEKVWQKHSAYFIDK